MNYNGTEIIPKILGRKSSFLIDDIIANKEQIQQQLNSSRVLVIGAGGSIGSAFVRQAIKYSVRALHLVDISENSLVELVRDLRSSSAEIPKDFATYALDFGGIEMRHLLVKEKYDYIVNFSALKHVRSERDPYTLMRLLQVNVLANELLLNWVSETQLNCHIFAVSSDKAVRSGNLMGASKAFMERVYLSRSESISFSSARFANVAFSDGSLLHSFSNRINKKQPISAPNDIRRYFISPEEAGQLCLLGCFVCNNKEIVYPLFHPEEDTMTFSDIAKIYLKETGLVAYCCENEIEAKEKALRISNNTVEWPCYFSKSDTSGEKECEEFVNPNEEISVKRFTHVGVIEKPLHKSRELIEQALRKIDELQNQGTWEIENLFQIIKTVVPEMEYKHSDKNLDQKM